MEKDGAMLESGNDKSHTTTIMSKHKCFAFQPKPLHDNTRQQKDIMLILSNAIGPGPWVRLALNHPVSPSVRSDHQLVVVPKLNVNWM
eukprot:1651606-Amphidinium_carterae.1